MKLQATNIIENQSSFKAGVNIKTKKSGLYYVLKMHTAKMEENSASVRVSRNGDFQFEPDNFGLPDKEGYFSGYLCDWEGGADSISSRNSSLAHNLRNMKLAEEQGNKTTFRSILDHYLVIEHFCNSAINEIRAKAKNIVVESIEDIRRIKGFEKFL